MGGALARSSSKRRLIVVFLRGAVDGLNVVVPHGEPDYYDARPTIAIGRAGANDGVIDLDGHFGLHPALAPMDANGKTARSRSCMRAARPIRRDRISTRRITWRAARPESNRRRTDG